MKAQWLLIVVLAMFVTQAVGKVPNPYKVLGVRTDANSEQIKDAFRKRTKKYHPDRSSDPNAKDKYAKVVNAYQLLKDKQRRQMYDMTGDDNQQQGGGGFGGGGFGFPQGGFMNMEDLFGAFGGFGGGGQGRRRQPGGGGQHFTFSFGGL